MPPTVSIITPSFNRAHVVGETAASVFNQTYPHWEWVIVDDGSTDNSWEILQTFAAKDERVKIFQRNREPKGACTCRNIAVQNCTGEYLIFLDTDDLLASFCLEQRVAAAQQNPECDFVIFPMLLFKNEPDDLRLLWSVENGRDDLLRVLEGDPICQGTGPLWKKASFQAVGLWREDLKLWQDVELHIRSFLRPVKYAKRMDLQPDVFLRISDVSLSRTGYHSLPKLQSRIAVFRYACETLTQKNLFRPYYEGIRRMGSDIMMSAVHSGRFEEAKRLLRYCEEHSVFNAAETKKLKNYTGIRQYKLYKMKPVNDYFLKKLNGLLAAPHSTVGKITWNNPVLV